MLTTKELQSAVNALPYPSIEGTKADRAGHREAVQAYREKVNRLESEWAAWLADEYAPEGLTEKQHNAIFAKAWENGHSSGYSEIENEYITLTDFLRAYLKG